MRLIAYILSAPLLLAAACSAPAGKQADLGGHAAVDLGPPARGTSDMTARGAPGADLARAGGDLAATDLTPPLLDTVTLSATLRVTDSTAPIAGATVCVLQHPEMPCATSNAQGAYSIELPANAQTGMLIDASGYASVLIALTTITYPLSDVSIDLTPGATASTFYTAAGTPYPNAGKGFLRVFFSSGASQSGAASATTTLTPAGGAGPLYSASDDSYGGALSATSASGRVRWAALAPGTILVSAHCGAGFTQQNYFGWPTSSITQGQVPIVAGYETHVGFGCF